MPSSPLLQLGFDGYSGGLHRKQSLQTFRALAKGTSFRLVQRPHLNKRDRKDETLASRWKRAKEHIHSLKGLPASEAHILSVSIGCHLAARAASLINTETSHRVAVMFLIVPDPKYRICEEDRKDKINRPDSPSAYDECCDLWNGSNNRDDRSPGEMLAKTLIQLAEQDVEIHLIASKLDTVAEWRGNTKKLYEATAPCPHVYWSFPSKPPSRYDLRVDLAPSTPRESIHADFDCTISALGNAGEAAPKKRPHSKARSAKARPAPKK